MKLADVKPGETTYTQLSSTALAVLVRHDYGWCVYVKGVPGISHDREWHDVRLHGDLLDEGTARAILANRFHPPIYPGGLPYNEEG